MTEFSRTKKYKDLRSNLQGQQNIAENTIQSEELSRLARRLNKIDKNNFKEPEKEREYDDCKKAQHARLTSAVERQPSLIKNADLSPLESLVKNDKSPLDNEYISQYLKEAKRYNVEHGNAHSEETSLDILASLQKGVQSSGMRPFPKNSSNVSLKNADLMSLSKQEKAENDESQYLSKDDIMKEVQNIMTNNKSSKPAINDSQYSMEIPQMDITKDNNQSMRQQLLNETTSMRAQLENYSDDVASLNTKVRRTNRILNVILVILVIALLVILAFILHTFLRGSM